MSFFNDFFGSDDRRIELSRLLISSLESRYSFREARQILDEGNTAKMTEIEIEHYNEWKPLEDESASTVVEDGEDFSALAARLAEHEKWME